MIRFWRVLIDENCENTVQMNNQYTGFCNATAL